MSYKTGENAHDRVRDIAVASITRNAQVNAAQVTADANSSSAWGKLAFEVIKEWL
jgi:hypothetical protein